MIVAVVAITAAAVKADIPDFLSTGYNVASKIIAKFDALGTTNDKRLPRRKTIGTKIYGERTRAIGFASALTVASLAPIELIYEV